MKVIIIGFMGVGKTTIGRVLSKKLNLEFIDMDEQIEILEGLSISEIFEKKGEEYFRQKETLILKEIINKDKVIISTGGGIIKNKENREILMKENNVIFLNANKNTLYRNLCKGIDKRPLLRNSKDLMNTIETMIEERYEKYLYVSKIKINTDNKNIEQVISEILVTAK